VTILNALLKEGSVDFSGERLARTRALGTDRRQVMISALRPNADTPRQ
jgi:hypothetical protein